MDDRSDLRAPPDVASLIDWLIEVGFAITRVLAGGQPNGNRLVALARGDEEVVIVCDRGVWELALRGDGWAAGLHTLHEARTGVVFAHVPGARLPQQHPSDDLAWMDAVPAFFSWRETTEDWRARLADAEAAGAERIRRRSAPPPRPPDHR